MIVHRERPSSSLSILLCLLLVVTLLPVTGASATTQGNTRRISVGMDGAAPNGPAAMPSMTSDGRYVAFDSEATNLVPGDTNSLRDVFFYDRDTGSMSLVSVSSSGQQANGRSWNPSISNDGRYIAFYSEATNLVSGSVSGVGDVYVRDRVAGTTTLVSAALGGGAADGHSSSAAISGNGRYVAFYSKAGNLVPPDANSNPVQHFSGHVFRRDLVGGTTVCVSMNNDGVQGNGQSDPPSISDDGSRVAFSSYSTNLVADDTNNTADVFVRDMSSVDHWTYRVSLANDASQGDENSWAPAISGDGAHVAFISSATNLVSGDTNGVPDYFVRRVWSSLGQATTHRVSVASDGTQGVEGSGMVYQQYPAINNDGTLVAFPSKMMNLVPGDTNNTHDVFLHNVVNGSTIRVSVATDGSQASNWSEQPSISNDGRYVAFTSAASNLVPGGWTAQAVYVRDRFGPADPSDPADPADPGDDVEPFPSLNVAGDSRYDTAVLASKQAYPQGLDPNGARTVVIATGRNWPDALGATSLAGALDGPVLLVATNAVPDSVLTEVRRLGAAHAIIVGGEVAVGSAVRAALLGGGLTVERIAGGSRYETADRVALRVIAERAATPEGYDGTAFVSTGSAYADAVACAPLAAAEGWPLFLVHPSGGILSGTRAAMSDVTRALVLGGRLAVSDGVEANLRATLGTPNVIRLSGDSRYATAAAISAWGVENTELGWDRVGIATGQAYPDALAGGVLQGKVGSVMLLTRSGSLEPVTRDTLAANKAAINSVTFFGGGGAVSPAVRSAVSAALQ